MAHTAFFYGTLIAPPVLHRVIWGSPTPPTPTHAALLTTRPAVLHGYQRRRVRGADYPAIVPAEGGEVRGVLVEGLSEGDVWRLDVFEGGEYVRRVVRVRVEGGGVEGDGVAANGGDQDQGGDKGGAAQGLAEDSEIGAEVEVDAEVYVWIAGPERLEPQEWDFKHFVREKMGAWVGGGEGADEGFKGA
ncbi:hypothetical protein C7974DRAFT_306053 [Boeremia exigua]|uniref:uncharacterized protein n=1 Tax=Boeremia exigua TaxID=749465 RepID=UPI001E8E7E38|nr:uncharacterized protein C7974DRAFT_306053 [Boeremia exigua]KAH6638733.1 hypothetical protein C7974DRAFT_306053 [Boeremia exigua]